MVLVRPNLPECEILKLGELLIFFLILQSRIFTVGTERIPYVFCTPVLLLQLRLE